ncbi:MAG: hypothetical protein AB1782_12300, partial [Cyanobacteriota bacterium]
EKLFYQKAAIDWKNVWVKYFKCLKNPDFEGCPVGYADISYTFSHLNNTYINYRKATESYKSISKKLIPEVNSLYKELKDNTGHNFDLLLDTVDDYQTIPFETRSFIVSLGIEIKALKDSIEINNVTLTELTSFIEVNNPNIKESVSYFDSINININTVNSESVNCMVNCYFKGDTNCSDICTK